MNECVWVSVPWYLPTFDPKAPGATQHLFVFRFKQQQKALSGKRVIFQLLCQLYLLSSPLAHFPGIPPSFYRAPLAFSKISAGIRARLSFSLGGFGKCQQRNHVNPTSSKSLYKLMHELEEWKSDLSLDDFFDLNECLLFSSIPLLLPIQFSIL